LSAEEDRALANVTVEELLALSIAQSANIRHTLHAYQISKRGNVLRVKAEAVR